MAAFFVCIRRKTRCRDLEILSGVGLSFCNVFYGMT